jgi:hypothetical protein
MTQSPDTSLSLARTIWQSVLFPSVRSAGAAGDILSEEKLQRPLLVLAVAGIASYVVLALLFGDTAMTMSLSVLGGYAHFAGRAASGASLFVRLLPMLVREAAQHFFASIQVLH